jgi:hypothetical protein
MVQRSNGSARAVGCDAARGFGRAGRRGYGKFKLKFPPWRVLLSSSGRSVLAIGVRTLREEGANDDLVFVARGDGRIVVHLGLDDLFGKGPAAVYSTGQWTRKYPDLAACVDEVAGVALVVAQPARALAERPIAVVSLQDGAVRHGEVSDISRSVDMDNRAALPGCIELAHEMGVAIAKERLAAIYDCTDMPIKTRVIAAGMLMKQGDARGRPLVVSLARRALGRLREEPLFDLQAGWLPILGALIGEDPVSDELGAMDFAVRLLPTAVGPEAIPMLAEVAALSERALRDTAREGALSMGMDAIPGLLLVVSGSKNDSSRRWAVNVIAGMHGGASSAVGDLLCVLQHAGAPTDESLCRSIIYALGEIGPAAARAAPILRSYLNDPSQSIRKRAREALQKICEPPK